MPVTAAGKNSVPACATACGSIVPPSVSLPAVRSCCNLSPGSHSGTGLLRLMGALQVVLLLSPSFTGSFQSPCGVTL